MDDACRDNGSRAEYGKKAARIVSRIGEGKKVLSSKKCMSLNEGRLASNERMARAVMQCVHQLKVFKVSLLMYLLELCCNIYNALGHLEQSDQAFPLQNLYNFYIVIAKFRCHGSNYHLHHPFHHYMYLYSDWLQLHPPFLPPSTF